MILISMTDFVLSQKRPIASADLGEADYYYEEYAILETITKYANFLKQPLELWMFVPCGDDGSPFEEDGTDSDGYILDDVMFKEYQQAKERCLFEGFEIIKDSTNKTVTMIWGTKEHQKLFKDRKVIGFGFSKRNQGTIENYIHYNLTLTQSAINQIKK